MNQKYLVFVDRDGVINFNRDDHVKNLEEFLFIPKAIKALVNLSNIKNIAIIVVTNQPIIDEKLASKETVENINHLLKNAVESAGGRIDKIYYCPHKKGNENCNCRKPKPGMFEKASKEFKISLKNSFLIGDQMSDIEAGKNIGSFTILVRTGLGNNWLEKKNEWKVQPDAIVNDIFDGAELILSKLKLK